VTSLEINIAGGLEDLVLAGNLALAIQASAGSSHSSQGWYRDPGGLCGNDFNTTGAVEITCQP
jgi:hypothetical protein